MYKGEDETIDEDEPKNSEHVPVDYELTVTE